MSAKSTEKTSVLYQGDAYQRFEATKRKNFSHSSRLEGLQVPAEKSNATLEAVLKKYRTDVNG